MGNHAKRFGVALCLALSLLVGCGGEDEEEGTSFLRSALSDFPVCNNARKGYLAYATDVARFFTCDGTAWTQVSIQGPTGTSGEDGTDGSDADSTYAFNASNQRIGAVAFADWPAVGIKFTDDAIAMFSTAGRYVNALCLEGYCSGAVTVTAGGISLDVDTFAPAKSYCSYTDGTCSGTCWLSKLPLENSLVQSRNSTTFLRADGTETATTAAITIHSLWLYDVGSCTSLATGSGICCSNFTTNPTMTSGVGVTNTYSFPASVPTYPFTSPLYFE